MLSTRYRWVAICVCVSSLFIVVLLRTEFVSEFRIAMSGIHMTMMSRSSSQVAISFRCTDNDATEGARLLQQYLSRQSLTIQSVFVHEPTGDLGMRAICNMPAIADVENLHIESKRVSNHGLASIGNASNLKMIVVHCPKVDCAGIQPVLKIRTLEGIAISETQVGDECMTDFAIMPQLKLLTVLHTRVTDKGVSDLRTIRSDIATSASNP